MKKLVVMCIAVAAACAAQAAAVQWNAGNIYLSDGTTKPGAGEVTAFFWESTTAFAATAAQLYAASQGDPTDISGYVKSASSNALGSGLNMTSGTSYAAGTEVYSAILYVNNKEGGYMASFGQVTAGTAKVTVSEMGTYNGGSLGGTPRGPAIDTGNWGSGSGGGVLYLPLLAFLLILLFL